jgi:hypothetical protein
MTVDKVIVAFRIFPTEKIYSNEPKHEKSTLARIP